jgi:hypothetical protein
MSAIKCGKCKGIHGSVQEVRSCYAGGSAVTTLEREDDLLPCERKAIETGKVAFHAPTEKQMAFLEKLLETKEHNFDAEAIASIRDQDRRAVSGHIDFLVSRPAKKATATAPAPSAASDVPEGYYAIDFDDTVRFFRVDCPTEGKWAGRTFVSVQASDEFHSIRNADKRNAILSAIKAQGIKESMVRYGHLIGRCGVCNRTLTDETSRAMGIGPVCREKF